MEIEYRPWGFYEVLIDLPNYKVKRITVLERKVERKVERKKSRKNKRIKEE